MESSTIELQLWIIIGLFLLVIIGQLACAFYKHGQSDKKRVDFSGMHERGEMDELILESGIALRKNPNNQDALYFGAKALQYKGKYSQAKEYIEKLIQVEPTLRANLEVVLDSLNEEIAANKSQSGV